MWPLVIIQAIKIPINHFSKKRNKPDVIGHFFKNKFQEVYLLFSDLSHIV